MCWHTSVIPAAKPPSNLSHVPLQLIYYAVCSRYQGLFTASLDTQLSIVQCLINVGLDLIGCDVALAKNNAWAV